MELSSLTAISPVDGRYRNKVENLSLYFSEWALIRYRVRVEIEYFIALCELPLPQLSGVNPDLFPALRKIYTDFTEADAEKVKSIESVTNHDVKAVEYFIKEKFDELHLEAYKEFIHFGLTSQDINNTSVPLLLKEALHDCYFPVLKDMLAIINRYAEEWKDIPMLAKTHGQPASPTRLGKEIRVFGYRLERQMALLESVPVSGKFGGATVLLKRAPEGTGIIAGGPARSILELAGIKNIRTKSLGSNNKQNVVLATIEGLKSMKTPEEVARLRGKSVSEILG